jgi:hypothetical protein
MLLPELKVLQEIRLANWPFAHRQIFVSRLQAGAICARVLFYESTMNDD